MRRVLSAPVISLLLLCNQSTRQAACSALTAAAPVESRRVDHYVTDAVLHRRWAVLADRTHPERPWTLQEVPWEMPSKKLLHVPVSAAAADPSAKATPLISAGMKVRLWRNDLGARIELNGTALESGLTGQTIHVRTGSRGTVLEGRVRGASSVELSTSGKWQTNLSDGWNQ